MRPGIPLLLLLAAGTAHAFEEYSQRELLSCEVCHASADNRARLTPRGREYRANGHTFAGPGGEPQAPPSPPPLVLPRPKASELMVRARAVLADTVTAVATGRYSQAAEGAARLQDLGGRIQGRYQADRPGLADSAAALREAAFRLERTVRIDGGRRFSMAPADLASVVGACLSCHTAAGVSEDDFSLAGTPEPRAGARYPPALPSRVRGPLGSRR